MRERKKKRALERWKKKKEKSDRKGEIEIRIKRELKKDKMLGRWTKRKERLWDQPKKKTKKKNGGNLKE